MRQGHAGGDVVFQARVRHAQVSAPAQQQVFGGGFGFGDALLGRAARAHVAGRQVQRAGAVAHLGHADERPAAGLLDIVGVGGDRQDVEAHGRAASG